MADAQYRDFTSEDAVHAATAALARAMGGTVTLRDVAVLSDAARRNLILRAVAVAPDGGASPVIVKATRSGSHDAAAPAAYDTSGLVKEWAATGLLARRAWRTGGPPALLAADLPAGVLVLADIGADMGSLVRPLRDGSAMEAERALTAYAVALARLHAGTLGCQAEHAAYVQAALPEAQVRAPGVGWLEQTARRAETMLGGTLPADELAAIALRLRAPGPWLALVHRDPCPDNVLLSADGVAHLIDFEFSAPGHALLDAAYWRMGFPTCWCAGRVPPDVAARVDAAYRGAVAPAVGEAADEASFHRESAMIDVVWMLNSLAWLLDGALAADAEWGIARNRGRILHYVAAGRDAAASRPDLGGIAAVTAGWLAALRARWPESAPLPLYPAFAPAAAALGEGG